MPHGNEQASHPQTDVHANNGYIDSSRLPIGRAGTKSISELLRLMPDATVVADKDGRIVALNDLVQKLFGYERTELLGASIEQLMPQRFRGGHAQNLASFQANPGTRLMGDSPEALYARHKNGTEIPISISLTPMHTEDGVFIVAAIRDVTDLTRTRRALEESEARYKDYYENAPTGYMSLDMATGQIAECNETAAAMFGCTVGEMIGRKPSDLYTPESQEIARTAMTAFKSQGKIHDIELQVIKPDGTLTDVRLDATAIRDASGAIIRSRSIWTDITERKQADRALEESEERYHELFDNANDIVYTSDLHGNFLAVNRAIEAVTGYTPDEALQLGVAGIVAPDHLQKAADMTERKIRGEQTTVYEIELVGKDGQRIPVEVSTRLVFNDGQPSAVQGIVRDITERRATEEAILVHSEELQHLNAQLVEAHAALSASKAELQEKSALLEVAFESEHERARHDSLTGVKNHAEISELLREQCAQAPDFPIAVLMIDIDGMKATNDTYGHQLGDQVLIALANALSRDGAVVGRYGGDEFVVALLDADRDTAKRYRDSVLARLAEIRLTDEDSGAVIPVVASFGIAVYPEEARTAHDLIKLADHAMYASRRERRAAVRGAEQAGPLDRDRAAEMVAEIVPLLTSPGELDEKLRLVSRRLSVGAGYDAVNFSLLSSAQERPSLRSTFGRGGRRLVEAWDSDQSQETEVNQIRTLLERSKQPIIIDDPQNDERVREKQREIVRAGKIQSALVAPMLLQEDLVGILSVASVQKHAFGPHDVKFLMAVATQVTAIVHMARLVDDLRTSSALVNEAQVETVLMLAGAAEAHDHTTGLHLHGVRALSESLALELDYSAEEATAIGLAAVLHDIGKMRVPDSILANTGPLGEQEWALMKHHTTWGSEFLSDRTGFELASIIALCHHEQWNGSGYPRGLGGDDIPEAATIVAVADALDAIISKRPYKAARPVAQAIQEIVSCSGKQFNPKVVNALVSLYQRNELPITPAAAEPEEMAA